MCASTNTSKLLYLVLCFVLRAHLNTQVAAAKCGCSPVLQPSYCSPCLQLHQLRKKMTGLRLCCAMLGETELTDLDV